MTGESKPASKQTEERMKEKKNGLSSLSYFLLTMLLFSEKGLLKFIMIRETESH